MIVRIIAKFFCIVPVLLIGLAVNQGYVALELRQTWSEGIPAMAMVEAFETTNRADVTYGYVHLQVTLEDGQIIENERMSLPQSLWPRVKGQDSLQVYVRPDAPQEIVISRLMPAHWLIAASQMGISLFGAILSGLLAFFWNRALRNK
ncbi:MAG: DUF3592 domain-containing protein [Bacteroidetes bacterium]|nr:DUF3592 domain-containing protein [Bacteroidota bacterium]MCY4232366.1 DUF3592 domain-containing protein [Bacteroidota bacterium]